MGCRASRRVRHYTSASNGQAASLARLILRRGNLGEVEIGVNLFIKRASRILTENSRLFVAIIPQPPIPLRILFILHLLRARMRRGATVPCCDSLMQIVRASSEVDVAFFATNVGEIFDPTSIIYDGCVPTKRARQQRGLGGSHGFLR